MLLMIPSTTGYLELLSQLTTVDPSTTQQTFDKRFDELFPQRSCLWDVFSKKKRGAVKDSPYRIVVIEDITLSRIIGTATLFKEIKFIRGCAACGHIEDVVVDSGYRGRQLGKKLLERLRQEAVEMGCYKIILDCSEENEPFYEKCGLTRKEVQMVEYI
jgi:glucosamine-phosphate N-acetyltransferase